MTTERKVKDLQPGDLTQKYGTIVSVTRHTGDSDLFEVIGTDERATLWENALVDLKIDKWKDKPKVNKNFLDTGTSAKDIFNRNEDQGAVL